MAPVTEGEVQVRVYMVESRKHQSLGVESDRYYLEGRVKKTESEGHSLKGIVLKVAP